MTAIGLAVAVPAVLAYNYIVRKNKTTMEKSVASAPICTPC
jgi:MotA/TolQ/ExbB proton channel family.